MADRLTQEQRRLNMSRVRATDTAPEWAVRRILHGHGFRYRLHRRDLPSRPDVVLPRYHAAILVHGCFWHGHGCSLFRMPKTREDFWSAKIAANRVRDVASLERLQKLGWRTLCVWECALRGRGRLPESELASRIIGFVTGLVAADEISEDLPGQVAARTST